jgi:hypothetical protein
MEGHHFLLVGIKIYFWDNERRRRQRKTFPRITKVGQKRKLVEELGRWNGGQKMDNGPFMDDEMRKE